MSSPRHRIRHLLRPSLSIFTLYSPGRADGRGHITIVCDSVTAAARNRVDIRQPLNYSPMPSILTRRPGCLSCFPWNKAAPAGLLACGPPDGIASMPEAASVRFSVPMRLDLPDSYRNQLVSRRNTEPGIPPTAIFRWPPSPPQGCHNWPFVDGNGPRRRLILSYGAVNSFLPLIAHLLPRKRTTCRDPGAPCGEGSHHGASCPCSSHMASRKHPCYSYRLRSCGICCHRSSRSDTILRSFMIVSQAAQHLSMVAMFFFPSTNERRRSQVAIAVLFQMFSDRNLDRGLQN